MNHNEIGLKLINALYDKGIDENTAKGILVFSKTAENWQIIYDEMKEHPEYDENRLQLFALALGETVNK